MYRVTKNFHDNVDGKNLKGGWFFKKGDQVSKDFMGFALFDTALKKGLITEVVDRKGKKKNASSKV